jgi:uncharacterized membrane protein
MLRQSPPARLSWAVHISLLSGLLISAGLLILGATRILTLHESRAEQQPAGVVSILANAKAGDGVAILNLGLLILMLTPVLRVAVLAVGWLIDREWRFGVIAVCVFALLMTSLILGTG